MTSAGGPPEGNEPPPVDLSKSDAPEPFDPYRFGKPDVPPPAEYAPPGYVPDPPEPDPPAAVPGTPPGATGPYGPPGHGTYPPMPHGPGGPPYSGYPPPYQQAPGPYPGPAGYGMAPYGPYPGARQGNGKAVAGMVLGIASIVLCWINFFNVVIIVPAIVFSLLGLNDSRSRGGSGRGQAIAGLACVAVGIVLTVVISILEFHLAHRCSGIDSGSAAYDRCVRNGL